jgi:flagellar biosynthesis protein FlhA
MPIGGSHPCREARHDRRLQPRNIGRIAGASALPAGMLILVGLMVIPVSPLILDISFVANIMISLAILMVALSAAKPLDFSSFPTVLLLATLFRLALNVASTRVVLVHGHEGTAAAGHVIEAFGQVLIGGDYVVGLFVFFVLMIINMVVITKGAGRVSEVSARFTLDALPGKQMAIDADLNAGLLSPEEAKARRVEVATEADFYGSMDGASKFVKGDAIAGLLILFVNIVGGLILGIFSHGLSFSEAGSNYVTLAIGDALVAQIPALLLSIAAAAIVTRVASPFDLSGQISSQFASPAVWMAVGAILFILGLVPSMPQMLILPAAALSFGMGWQLAAPRQRSPMPARTRRPAPDPSHIEWADVSDASACQLEIGYALVTLVDERKGSPLMTRITGIRRQLSKELGFVVPPVKVSDDLSLPGNVYRISVAGVIVGEDEVFPNEMLALDSGDLVTKVVGRPCKDPTFGLDALWIPKAMQNDAIAAGYTVVDPATVVATHLNNSIVGSAAELFGIDDAQALIDNLKVHYPQLAQNLTPGLFAAARRQPLQIPARRTRAAARFPQDRRGDGIARRAAARRNRSGRGRAPAHRRADRPDDRAEPDAAARRHLQPRGRDIAQPGRARQPRRRMAVRTWHGDDRSSSRSARRSSHCCCRRAASRSSPHRSAVRRCRGSCAPLSPTSPSFRTSKSRRTSRPKSSRRSAPKCPASRPGPKPIWRTNCMRIEPAEQFSGTAGRAPRARGYGESVEALVEEYSPLVRKIAWQVFSRVSRTSELDDLIQTGLIALIEASRQL